MMVAFDTASETFHEMTPPPVSKNNRVNILAMGGLLVAADFGTDKRIIDLWFFEDYGVDGRWERRHRLDTGPIYYGQLRLPPAGDDSWLTIPNRAVAGTDEGDIILRVANAIVVHNVKTKTLRVMELANETATVLISPFVFRESLVQHQLATKFALDQLAWGAAAAEKDGTPQAAIIHLPDDTIADILLRLPTSSILRSGAVCKPWRRVTTSPHFLSAHHARRRTGSVSVILHTTVDGAPWPGRGNNLPPRRITVPRGGSTGTGSPRRGKKVTRQWAQLPLLHGDYRSHDQEYAFFFHQSSGEFRLLCRNMARRIWFVVSTSAAQPRQLVENIDAAEFIPWLPMMVSAPVVPLHGNLHWSP
ncbi:hypothetical protein PR202_ga28885 [Eleusine coracana subsp. coracana]|uniref:F-box domain-containing protein n=1 Tax=Eleusine coracana subsp. coracana TaxID=191504 RepID=A0AAV5DKF8_ELECO|nr:hypothetical protein PR202_ga28885 [Eleusine coracana subsp. coracana]